MNSKKGFTLIEVIILIVILALIGVLSFIQYSNLTAMHRDEIRKSTINTIYYALENSFYQNYGYYPESISEQNLPVVAPELWTDPDGHRLNTPESDYIYQPINCYQGRCTEYILKAHLEKESDFFRSTNTN
ncbi:prepilin-type N-terminal cleavage/methylation domain-containing protein [Candidatus Saccharibacteria bacterium]|nr:prepilin-type N-terminal cleavage/methylation domain-containing protein [Candidatus Saccharibacteria bacterium]